MKSNIRCNEVLHSPSYILGLNFTSFRDDKSDLVLKYSEDQLDQLRDGESISKSIAGDSALRKSMKKSKSKAFAIKDQITDKGKKAKKFSSQYVVKPSKKVYKTGNKTLKFLLKWGTIAVVLYLIWIAVNLLYFIYKSKMLTARQKNQEDQVNAAHISDTIFDDEAVFENPIVKMSCEEFENFVESTLNLVIRGKWNQFDEQFAAPYIKACQQRLNEKPNLDVHARGWHFYTDDKVSECQPLGPNHNEYIRLSEIKFFPNLDDIVKFLTPEFKKEHAILKQAQIDRKFDSTFDKMDPKTYEYARRAENIKKYLNVPY